MPMATSPVYAASKHAVVGFTTSWAVSIHAVGVCARDEADDEHYLNRQELK